MSQIERLPDGNLRIHVDFAFRRFSDRKRIVEPTRETPEEVSLEKLRSITTPIWSEQHEQLGLP